MKEFKILLLGADAVGKTTCFQSITGELVDVSYRPTLVVNVGYKIINVDKKSVGLRIWDLGGQVFLRESWSCYYEKTDGSILMYDISRRYTFEDILNWMQEIKKYVKRKIPIILVGNKSDLENERMVSLKEGEELQKEIGAVGFFETSALLNKNIKEVFEHLAKFLKI
ncbi:MAG: Rab family GTPase [Candidatus Helarchaeota archaeon]